ncbi:MED8 [Candida oxycetoniae]|uniref:Mediator of RNA polymerase II transcription subunit 8 n=1 Tax=Candida oxycetoniae TaxID=497107 RepID=A0AAI9WXE5_9ASCO|nr:MED8 [Candida oxycetoniae]KAI3403685.1 MED8 [Candida oxycetoniae]
MNHTPVPTTPLKPLPIDFSQIPVDALESIRNRLNQIHVSLRKLSDQINNHNRYPTKIKLPSFTHFQNQFQVLITQLASVTNILYENEELLRNTNVYPTVNFPTTQHEGLLTTLLRKKALPEVNEWINSSISSIDKSQENGGLDLQKEDEFTIWCLMKIQELRDDYQFYGFHTVDELEYMETPEGKIEAKAKKDKENEKEEIELRITLGGKKGLHPNQISKFMCQGQL